jgi:hypothetical protein
MKRTIEVHIEIATDSEPGQREFLAKDASEQVQNPERRSWWGYVLGAILGL